MKKKVLVLQHPNLPNCRLPLTHARFRLPESRVGRPLRLEVAPDTEIPADIAAELDAQQIDYAVLDDIPFAELGLLVSDMDSTLITIECIDEIAACAGLKDQVSAITERAMRGELDFSQSLRERVGLLKGLPESVLDEVYQSVLCLSPGAEQLVAECRQHGVKFLLVSGGFTFFTDRLKTRLGLDWAYANELETENSLLTGKVSGRIIDSAAKAELLQQYRDMLGLRQEQVVAVGDGANDIPMLQAAGFGVAYHAKPKTRQQADLCINHNDLSALRGWFA